MNCKAQIEKTGIIIKQALKRNRFVEGALAHDMPGKLRESNGEIIPITGGRAVRIQTHLPTQQIPRRRRCRPRHLFCSLAYSTRQLPSSFFASRFKLKNF
jgi:hypothetical protein